MSEVSSIMNGRGRGNEWSDSERMFLVEHNDSGIHVLKSKLKRSRHSINGQRKKLRLKVTRAAPRHNEKPLTCPIRSVLRARRKQFGWSQRDISAKMGRNEDWFGQVEVGKGVLTDRMLLRLCDLLKLKISFNPTISGDLAPAENET